MRRAFFAARLRHQRFEEDYFVAAAVFGAVKGLIGLANKFFLVVRRTHLRHPNAHRHADGITLFGHVRPLFYAIQGQPAGLCCHPYDCATWLVAEEAGVVLTDGLGRPLDGPLDVTTGLSWAAYANPALRGAIEPLILSFFASKGLKPGSSGQ